MGIPVSSTGSLGCGNWQIILALLLVHSVMWASQQELTVVSQFLPSPYINQNFGKPISLLAT
jgi:hypothetical protein